MKYRVSVIDSIPLYGQHKIGIKDKDGEDLSLGDAVQRSGQRMLIGWRYGQYVLKPLFSGAYLSINEKSDVKKENTVVAAPGEWLIIGNVGDDLWPKVMHLFPKAYDEDTTMLEVLS